MKDVRLSLPFIEMMKIGRLTSPLSGVPRLSSPRSRLRYGRRLALLFCPNLTLDLCTLSLALSLALFPSNFSSCFSPRISASVFADYPTFPSSAEPRALWSLTCPSAHPFLMLNFLRLPPIYLRLLPLAQAKLPVPCKSIFLALAWIFFTFSIFPGFCIPFLPSGRHLSLFPSTRWESLCTLLLPSGLSFSPPAYQDFLNASFYRVHSFWSLNSILSPCQTSFRPGRSTLNELLYLSQSISDWFNKPRPGSWTILSTIDFSKAFDSVRHPALFHKLISAGLPPCFCSLDSIFPF